MTPGLHPAQFGRTTVRITWVPGHDQLRGMCYCGAAHEAGDPAELWDWLDAHPIGHQITPPEPVRTPLSTVRVPADGLASRHRLGLISIDCRKNS